jgi:hypothetical protein
MEYVTKQRVVDRIPWSVDTALLRGLQDGLTPEYVGSIYIQVKADSTLVHFEARKGEHWIEVVRKLPDHRVTYDECIETGRDAARYLNEYVKDYCKDE